MEKWKKISDSPMYDISSMGRIRSWNKMGPGNDQRKKPIILKAAISNSGYRFVCLKNNNKKENVYIARMVGLYFVDNPENKPEINHKNGIKTDDRASNVEWSTRSENMKHAHNTGLQSAIRNENNYNHKLTNNEVLDIRNAYRLGCFTMREIGKAYNVSSAHISDIINMKKRLIQC